MPDASPFLLIVGSVALIAPFIWCAFTDWQRLWLFAAFSAAIELLLMFAELLLNIQSALANSVVGAPSHSYASTALITLLTMTVIMLIASVISAIVKSVWESFPFLGD